MTYQKIPVMYPNCQLLDKQPFLFSPYMLNHHSLIASTKLTDVNAAHQECINKLISVINRTNVTNRTGRG